MTPRSPRVLALVALGIREDGALYGTLGYTVLQNLPCYAEA